MIAFYGWIIFLIGDGMKKVSEGLWAVWLLFGFLILPILFLVWGIRSSG